MQLDLETIRMNKFISSDLGNVHQLHAVRIGDVVPGLADCPWPHPDSHCSPCTIYLHDQDFMLYHVWGSYGGDANRKRFYAQTSCTDPNTTRMMRLVFIVRKLTTDPVPTNHGLFIGLMAQDTLEDPDKLYDPSKWPWAGYLADLGTANEYYYICVDINEGFWYSDVPIFLFFCTNAEYNVWSAGGYGKTLPPGLPLFQYNMNEPGQTDGWTQQDDYWHLAVIPYMQGAYPMVEGYCQIRDPHFPSTVNEGAPYNFDFIIDQLTNFPCGCPETVVWQIYDRDTNEPIHDPVTHLLECGWTGVKFDGSLTFTGGGTFHGRLYAGHKTNGEWQPDDHHDFDVVVTPYPCSHWTNSTDCEARGCWWWNGSCHTDQPTECSDLNNQSDCERWGCAWWNNACHGYVTCEEINNQTDCELYKCYWYNNSCHSKPYQPEICDWIDSKGGPTALTPTLVVEIINSYIFGTPPSGWTFIPTVKHAVGVVNYYLGLGIEGDAMTGCDYY